MYKKISFKKLQKFNAETNICILWPPQRIKGVPWETHGRTLTFCPAFETFVTPKPFGTPMEALHNQTEQLILNVQNPDNDKLPYTLFILFFSSMKKIKHKNK